KAQEKAGSIGGIDCVMPDAKRETGDALKAGSRTIFGFSRLPSSAASVFCLKPQALLNASVPAGWLPSLPTLKFHPPGGREWHALHWPIRLNQSACSVRCRTAGIYSPVSIPRLFCRLGSLRSCGVLNRFLNV